MEIKPEGEINERATPRKARLALILATWIVALVVTFPHPSGLLWVWMFPAGLKIVYTKAPPDLMDSIIGWILYAAIMVWLGKAEKRWLFAIVYVILVLVLAVNIGGCRHFHRGLEDLH